MKKRSCVSCIYFKTDDQVKYVGSCIQILTTISSTDDVCTESMTVPSEGFHCSEFKRIPCHD